MHVYLEDSAPIFGYLNSVESVNGHSDNRINWSRPEIVLGREVIHWLKGLPREKIIEYLYEAMHNAERKNAALAKHQKEKELQDALRFIPRERIEGFVYFISGYKGLVKIGCSRNPERRLKELKGQYKIDLEIESTWKSSHMYYHEARIHNLFSTRRMEGEWFDIQPWHENVVNWAAKRNRI